MIQDMAEDVIGVQVQLAWPDGLADQASVANQFFLLSDGDDESSGSYLLFGHVGPPAWATPEVVQQKLEQTGGVLPVQPRGAFFMSRHRLRELHKLIHDHLGED